MTISSIPISTIHLAPVEGANHHGLLKGKMEISNVVMDIFAIRMIRPAGNRTRWEPFCKKEVNELIKRPGQLWSGADLATILGDLVRDDSATTKIQGYDGDWTLYALPEETELVWSKKEQLWREAE